mgnify:CR=1 FL=1
METDYDKMSIYDLRNYARSMGVLSPTTLKRGELIVKIDEIINGKAPQQKSTNKGRPPKHKASDGYVLDLILPKNLFANDTNDARYKPIVSQFDRPAYKNTLCENSGSVQNQNILFKGYYQNYSNDFGLASFKGYITSYSKENAIILKPLAEKYKIKKGDYLVGVASYLPEKNVLLASDINYVNDVKVSELDGRLSFDEILPSYPTQKFCINSDIDQNCPVLRGGRITISVKSQMQKLQFAIELLNKLSMDNNLKTLVISIDDSPEDIGTIMFKCPDVEVCTLSASMDRPKFFEKVATLIANCKNRLECGQDIAVVFYNATSFIESYCQNLVITQNLPLETAKVMAVNKFKDTVNLSRNKQNCSLTMLAFDIPQDLQIFANCNINLFDDLAVDTKTSSAKIIKQ